VGLFATIRDEIDTAPLFEALRGHGVRAAFPKIVEGVRELQFGFVADWTQLVLGRYQIPEPQEANAAIEMLEAVVVPGLGFDAVGGRLGYGAGWYDRTLMSYRGWSVGFGFDVQVVEEVPMESYDRRLDLVVTDERTLVVDTR
jgi:5-formyltetrahydrofolate cyclo-ligase